MNSKICVVTTTRADYGILRPLIKRIENDPYLELRLVVTGTHLEAEFGYTVQEIVGNGDIIDEKIPIIDHGEGPKSSSQTIANAIIGFANYFTSRKPDILVLLGDRTEVLGVAIAAMNECIPIAHIHGGELTEGAVDDSVRHCLTKLSQLHFPATTEYQRRIIQMGEQPDSVYKVGAMGVENALKVHTETREWLANELGIDLEKPFILITYHPETRSNVSIYKQMEGLQQWIQRHSEYEYLVTKANADFGGSEVNQIWKQAATRQKNIHVESSLGQLKYFTALKYCKIVIGNSSSGIIEAPSFHVPTINIGDRQKGRIAAKSVVHCGNAYDEIDNAVEKANNMSAEFLNRVENPYGNGTTSEKIIQILKERLKKGPIPVRKSFYDKEN